MKSKVTSCNQSLYALRVMRQHGLPSESLQKVLKATSLSKLLYSSPSWWGFTSKATRDLVQSFIRRARKWGYYSASDPEAGSMCVTADNRLFRKVISNPGHVLNYLLPQQQTHTYFLRSRAHNFQLPRKDDRNFFNRMLFSKIF